MKKTTIQKLISKLQTGLEPLGSFDQLEGDIKKLTVRLHQKVEAESLDSVNSKLDEFRKSIDLTPVLQSLEKLQSNTDGIYSELDKNLTQKANELFDKVKNAVDILSNVKNDSSALNENISLIQNDSKQNANKTEDLSSKYKDLSVELTSISEELTKIVKDVEQKMSGFGSNNEKFKNELEVIRKEFDKFTAHILTLLNNVGGGNMNRQIVVGGNVDTLKKYTDINIKAGSNMTITYANNETTKRTDITFSSSGGSSSTAGVIRSVNNVNTSQSVGSVIGTDYVYIATAGIKLDLPPAVSNTNLYTIKNVSVSSILVVPTGAETIDTSSNLILATQFTSVDLISDGVDKWEIT